jgi:2-C-methyl-D-erythritol 4-phosphate cytidylyltransferase
MIVSDPGLEPRCFALVPCAGTGSRAGMAAPKQYAAVAGRPLVAHTLDALAQVRRLVATLVVLSPQDRYFDHELPGFADHRRWVARVGGASRAETVANGLAELRERGAQPQDWVLVHDAARALIRPEWVDQLIDACADHEVGGLLALPLADTLKSEADGQVRSTVDRQGKWAAQTPQMFRLGLLAPALQTAMASGMAITDESSAIEAHGHHPKLVPGNLENFKLTWPGDFVLAERLLNSARRGPEVLAMVPAKDFALSQRFYADLGFECTFTAPGLAGFRLGATGFLLQDFHVAEHASNFVMILNLPDLDVFWLRLQNADLAARYGVRLEPPALRPWGRRDMTVTDPGGVLWRVAQHTEAP